MTAHPDVWREVHVHVSEIRTSMMRSVWSPWTAIAGGFISNHFNPEVTINLFKLEFTIVNFIHYKPRIAVAILDL